MTWASSTWLGRLARVSCNFVRSSESAAYSMEGDSRLVGADAGADALEVCCEHMEGREWREVRKEFQP